MGSKKTLPTFFPFQAQAVTGTNNYPSPSTFIANLDNIGAQVIFTGTMTGTLVVEVSNDNTNFDSLTFDPVLDQPSGSALHFGIDLNQLPWPYLRFSYLNASGSGVLTVSIFGKDLN